MYVFSLNNSNFILTKGSAMRDTTLKLIMIGFIALTVVASAGCKEKARDRNLSDSMKYCPEGGQFQGGSAGYSGSSPDTCLYEKGYVLQGPSFF